MSARTVLITGANGGIGSALCRGFKESGWKVIASDYHDHCQALHDHYLQIELSRFCSDAEFRGKVLDQIASCCEGNALNALVNNAAVQILGRVEDLTAADWRNTFDVNLMAPFLLIQGLLPLIEKVHGSVVNIGSIHAQLTKPAFTAYATSKAALSGLTRSMAVELGARIRVNAICPAAIGTQMLLDGFAGQPDKFQQLEGVHPCGHIGTPIDVAALAMFLCSEKAMFINGATLGVDGGIAARLHDPV